MPSCLDKPVRFLRRLMAWIGKGHHAWYSWVLRVKIRRRLSALVARLRRAKEELSFVLTNHASWKALVGESGLTQPKAITLTTTTLDAALFDHRPG
jgi:hypothetical protein